jgi:hypothetical protein
VVYLVFLPFHAPYFSVLKTPTGATAAASTAAKASKPSAETASATSTAAAQE